MNSQTYVSDPNLWETFYKNMAKNTFNPYKYRKNQKKDQIGRGLNGRYRRSYMIPVNSNTVKEEPNPINTTLVTPVAAAEERAVSEYKDEKKKKEPRVKLVKRIKKITSKNYNRKKRTTKRRAPKRKTKNNKRNIKTSGKSSSRKRKFNPDFYDSVWNQPSDKKRKRK